MNSTTLLATTQSHHVPYLDISQTQQPYFELSKDLNTIHAYGTLPLSLYYLVNTCWNMMRTSRDAVIRGLVMQCVGMDGAVSMEVGAVISLLIVVVYGLLNVQDRHSRLHL